MSLTTSGALSRASNSSKRHCWRSRVFCTKGFMAWVVGIGEERLGQWRDTLAGRERCLRALLASLTPAVVVAQEDTLDDLQGVGPFCGVAAVECGQGAVHHFLR